MSQPSISQKLSQVDPDDLDKNTSGNPSMHDVLAARLHRRYVLKGGVGALTMASLGTLGLAACGGSDSAAAAAPSPMLDSEIKLGFNAVGKTTLDKIVVPEGYTASVLYATGDPIDPALGSYKNDGTDSNFAQRAGDHHDGMHFFGLTASGSPDPASNARALLVINHENISGTVQFMHPAGQTNIAAASVAGRPEAEVVKEIDAHGVSVIELEKTAGKFTYKKASSFNRRITAATVMNLSGPASGSVFTKTKYSTSRFIST